jgi:phosphate acetyltransferase
VEAIIRTRADRGMTAERASLALEDPVTYGCVMVSEGDADACVAGAITATARVVRSAMRYIGPKSADSQVSSCFIMLLRPEHPIRDVMLIGDCALMIDPDAEQLAEIAVATGETAIQLLGLVPEVAMLSFSTDGSARHSAVSKVRRATRLVRELRSDWRVVGEVQLDAAVVPELLARKAPAQAGENPCNVLIFPNLDAGNIGYKLIERFGGAQAIGPVLQGLAKPVNDLSRGCSEQDIVNIIAVSAAQVRSLH